MEATGRCHWASIRSDSSQLDIATFLIMCFFMVNLLKKGKKRVHGYAKAPINNRGMTYQNDEKDLSNTTEYFFGGVKLAEYHLND